MIDIINIILIALAALILIRFCVWMYKRITLIFKLTRLVKQHSGELKFLRFPFLPNSISSEKPDVSVKILDTVYLIRLYSGGGKNSHVHFASDKFSVRYMKMASKMVSSGRWRTLVVMHTTQAHTVGAKVFVMPPMKTPEELEGHENVEKIMIFNPAPNAVSYVTKEKTTIKLAFTGDEMHDMKIFTGSSFVAYADRQTRKDDEMMYF